MTMRLLYITIAFSIISSGLKAQWNQVFNFYHDSTFQATPTVTQTDVFNAKSVVFFNDSIGFAACLESHIFNFPVYTPPSKYSMKTSDGGVTWQNIVNPSGINYNYSVQKCGKDTLFKIEANDSEVHDYAYSTDHGITWNSVYTVLGSAPIGGYHFKDTKTGYFSHPGGLGRYSGTPATYSTTLNGSNSYALSGLSVWTIDSAKSVCIVDTGKRLIMSQDLGTTWTSQYYSNRKIWKMMFAGDQVGYAVCDSGKVLRTGNGGANWNLLNTETTKALIAIEVYNDSILLAGGKNGFLAFSYTNGNVWTTEIMPDSSDITSIQISGNFLYVLTAKGHLYKRAFSIQGLNLPPQEDLSVAKFVYPNPLETNGTFKLESLNPLLNYEIVSMLGKLEGKGTYVKNGNSYTGNIGSGSGQKIIVSYDVSGNVRKDRVIVR